MKKKSHMSRAKKIQMELFLHSPFLLFFPWGVGVGLGIFISD